jgi:capsular polysaccharide biosynthesis protein
MRSKLSVTNTTNTRMLDISATSPSPSEAAAIANEYAKVASEYIHETMAIDKPNIMSVALEPTNPISPNRTRNIALGFILGGLAAAGIVIFRYLMDDKLKTPEDIRQYTGLVTLAVVPIEDENEMEIKSKKNKKNQRRKT